MNHRAIMEDRFDFIFTLFAAFLFFIVMYGLLIGSIEDQNQETVQKTGWAEDAYNLIIDNKIKEETGQMINIPELQRQLDNIQQQGYISSPDSQADFPDSGGFLS